MIQQVLNRDFVLGCMADVAKYIEQATTAGERRGEETELSGLSSAERQEILDELRTAQRSEEVESSGQKSYDGDQSRRGESRPMLDDVSFFSSSPIVSNVQSAIEQHFDKDNSDGL